MVIQKLFKAFLFLLLPNIKLLWRLFDIAPTSHMLSMHLVYCMTQLSDIIVELISEDMHNKQIKSVERLGISMHLQHI